MRAVTLHEGAGRELVHALKYRGRRDVAELLAARAGALWSERAAGGVVVPIPLHRRRERARGYNQSVILAQAIARAIPGLKIEHALMRRRSTRSQTMLDRAARRLNVAAAFALRRPAAVIGRAVYLVDDVVTTGATLEAAARALRSAGPASIAALVGSRAELD